MQGGVTSPGGVSGGASIGVKTQDLGGARRGASGVRRVKLAHSQHRGPRGGLAGGAGAASRSIQCRRQQRSRRPGWPGLEGRIVQRSKMKLRAHGVPVLRPGSSVRADSGRAGLRSPCAWDPARPDRARRGLGLGAATPALLLWLHGCWNTCPRTESDRWA